MVSDKWIKIRQLGKNKFSLIYGSFFWGCICATACITPLIFMKKINSIFVILNFYILWLIGGFFYGRNVWEKQEKIFKE